jgi:hypothetical protein
MSQSRDPRLWAPLKPDRRPTLWERMAHSQNTDRHDPTSCPLCRAAAPAETPVAKGRPNG